MDLLNRLRDAISGRKKQEVTQQVYGSVQFHSPLCSNYENLFAQVRPLIDEMKTVLPYGVGRNGARLPLSRTPELAILQSPNESMSWSEFMDVCFATWLTESELNIRVHFNGRRVVGYTVLPVGCRQRVGGEDRFYVYLDSGESEYLSNDEVITLRYSRSPRDIDMGISPGTSVMVWTQIDDLVAQCQRAFFENGAIPATITFIRASTRDRYEAKRKELEGGLKGAENRNKTVYAWRQQLDDGSTGDEIEVKTIQGNNSTIGIYDIIRVVNDHLNKSVGVSNFILGDDSSAKYDNAELSDRQFTKRRVYPALLAFWGQFQHGLDRVCNGLGYAISFDLDIPELTDRLKVKAEIKKTQAEEAKVRAEISNLVATRAKTNAETLLELVKAGADPMASVVALGLDGSWGALAKSLKGGVSQEAASSTKDALPATRVIDAYEPSWETGDETAREYYEVLLNLAKKIMLETDAGADFDEVKRRLYEIAMRQAKEGAEEGLTAISKLEIPQEIKSEIEKIVAEHTYEPSEEMSKALEERTEKIAESFRQRSQEAAAKVLEESRLNSWPKAELANKLSEAIPRQHAEIIARNEHHAAINYGRYDTDSTIAKKYNLELELEWVAHDGCCPICAALDGTTVPLGDAFPEHIHTEDGNEVVFEHNYYNAHGRQPDAHVNCRCTFSERVKL